VAATVRLDARHTEAVSRIQPPESTIDPGKAQAQDRDGIVIIEMLVHSSGESLPQFKAVMASLLQKGKVTQTAWKQHSELGTSWPTYSFQIVDFF
jgi:hypothetical protein